METIPIKLTLKIADAQALEAALYDLERWLKDAGIPVELEVLPPTEEELGGKAVALVLLLCGLLNESVETALEQMIHWQEQHQNTPIELSLTGREEVDEPIRERMKHKPETVHIEIREPEPPPEKEKAQMIAPPPPKPPIKRML